ncbi:MAG: pyrimidine-nucleoside phosphorylase, partial [Lachnospiraceae bacterium]|nr:pyrimidine-nucleoside phosphorylase [Lachnospiraceae bacterium]
KKIAAGSDAIVLDVTVGSGAFMKTKKEAEELAACMVRIGKNAGLSTRAIITDMDEPLGRFIGNSLEVIEAIDVLKGKGPEDTRKVSLEIAAQMVMAAGKAKDRDEALGMAEGSIADGKALEALRRLITGQGGDPRVTEDTSLFDKARIIKDCVLSKEGYVERIHCDMVGNCVKLLGGGRRVKGESIDPSVGVELLKKKGDPVRAGEAFARIFANDEEKLKEAEGLLFRAYVIGKERPGKEELILGMVS